MIRVAAIGDLHVQAGNAHLWRDALAPSSSDADLLLLAGDLTDAGTRVQGELLVEALEKVQIPIVAVLGNHDCEADEKLYITRMLRERHVHVLDGGSVWVESPSGRIGVAGGKGFGGGFDGACGNRFGEREMKSFIETTEREAHAIERSLHDLARAPDTPRIVLLHYSPVPDTLAGERLEIFPFLGSYLLERAIDTSGADLVVHGHAHLGKECGRTARGTPVRNVAQPVIQAAYRIYGVPGAKRILAHGETEEDLVRDGVAP